MATINCSPYTIVDIAIILTFLLFIRPSLPLCNGLYSFYFAPPERRSRYSP
jgi:hypothetical protein